MTNVKPCPFCGESTALTQDDDGEWYIICKKGHVFQFDGMGERTLSVETLENVLKTWNTRWNE